MLKTTKTPKLSLFNPQSLIILALLITSNCGIKPANTTPKPKQSLDNQTPIRSNINSDVQALVELGDRITGTQNAIEASKYILNQFQQAGYATEVQTFTYSKFIDRGSSLTVKERKIEGLALRGSSGATITAKLVTVPNYGRKQDFESVNVQGAIAIVQRGEIQFIQKAKNAVAAGAVGLIIVNNEDDNFVSTLGEEVEIPVFALAGADSNLLLADYTSPVTLEVKAAKTQVTGRNIIAYQPGVTQPKVLLGAHYDSVVDSPGANDNASGTAVVLDLARSLAQTDLSQQAWFVAFDGEEDGLHGSRALVEAMGAEKLAELEAMFNFDMVGVNSELLISGTASLTDIVQQSDSSVAKGFAGGSDHIPFREANVPILFFTRGLDPNYHSSRDLQVDSQLLLETSKTALNLIQEILAN